VVIAGGGDTAVDWALSLAEVAQRVSVIHRRDQFRAAPESEARLKALVKARQDRPRSCPISSTRSRAPRAS